MSLGSADEKELILRLDAALFEVLLDRLPQVPDTASVLGVGDLVVVPKILELPIGEAVALLNLVSVEPLRLHGLSEGLWCTLHYFSTNYVGKEAFESFALSNNYWIV
jgi:hypothetical protein